MHLHNSFCLSQFTTHHMMFIFSLLKLLIEVFHIKGSVEICFPMHDEQVMSSHIAVKSIPVCSKQISNISKDCTSAEPKTGNQRCLSAILKQWTNQYDFQPIWNFGRVMILYHFHYFLFSFFYNLWINLA